uniref:Transthyretin-like family protein n=1 Tax=Plectus sambesii TaxID=2011161 RepID=A0A914WH30_9BILA
MKSCILLALFCTLLGTCYAFRQQSAGVRGRLMCGDKPAANVLVKLMDEDDGPDPDDTLDSVYTDSEGKFQLKGDTREMTNIDPEVRIYHDCLDYGLPCQREWVIRVPDKYISSGATPKKFMELGVMNLEVELEDEDQDCIHRK